ncbi:CCR4-NOT transcription complex subunit 10-A [Galendromus occidentalis]|uniref:CCR4-NOT transcription complex subunit 10 n=1 Tax=Galendromus occidentalis TaxID=34638 RepID=A0AAJ6QPR0_9ACAR|nr:CCR4-NOT transcription complex subunit 10-A [Galendromus occidentalis]
MADQDSFPDLETTTDEEKQLADKASRHFKNGNFKEAERALLELKERRPTDLRVAQNLVLSGRSSSLLTELESILRESQGEFDDLDSCVLLLNTALLQFKAQKYHRAQQILEKLLPFLEPLNEALSRDLLFLYMETCLRLNYPERVPSLIGSLESLLFGRGTSRNQNSSQNRSTSPEEKNAEFKPLVNQYRVRCLLALRSLKACKREVKTLNGEDRDRNDKDEINTVVSVFLRAQLEHHRDNGRKAVKIFNTLQGKQSLGEKHLAAMFYNDMACIHFKAGKSSLALLYARKAVEEYRRQVSCGEPHRPKLLFDLLYNVAVCKLFCENYQVAFEDLLRCTKVDPANPSVWLRLAECSIMIHQKSHREKLNPTNIVKRFVGEGAQRKILLAEDPYSKLNGNDDGEEIAPTIHFAARALRVCLVLISGQEVFLTKIEATNGIAPCATAFQELRLLRNSAICASAYVHLCLGDFGEAQAQSELLLTQERLSGAQRVLGRLYCAEALLMQDQLSEAVEHLKSSYAEEMTSMPSAPADETEVQCSIQPEMSWLPSSAQSTKQIFLYNLAVAYTLREELNKADEILETLLKQVECPPQHVVRLAIYLHLQQGRPHLAKQIICQGLPLLAC